MDIFRSHSIQLAKRVLRVGNITFAMECYLGDSHPRTGIAIYSARVDSVLSYGVQIVLTTADATLRHLEKVQISFLRRLMHVHKRSMTAILFSETGFTPVRYRRLTLALRYLLQLLAERLTTSKLASLRIDACSASWSSGKKNWLSDITHVLARLYQPIHISLEHLCSLEDVNDLVSTVETMWKDEVADIITGSPTTSLLAARYNNTNAPLAIWTSAFPLIGSPSPVL